MTTELEVKLIPCEGFRMPTLDGMPSGSVTVVGPVRELDATYYDTPDLELAHWGIRCDIGGARRAGLRR